MAESITSKDGFAIGGISALGAGGEMVLGDGGAGSLRCHWCQLNVKPSLCKGFALTPSPSPSRRGEQEI
ncbi:MULTISPECIES: hypothetical protein [unclassified Tolypothrix]|uniref:hypothetical protein n=1 Tax=unclassified Tolypothrix TaxID=2649714 RepID=UPI0012D81AE7|nr:MULTISPECIES: hypothetical protein [unclassified Tolypothrix]MBE9087157.1 hypothetical protein [Tolypothrix sp. LEGE 11397]UYD24007.1 hypothetical protein HGR01_21175 [Tolypothrix sp. PCC 7712]UYD33763.1 hypothetical protein HG267_33555 [Tolypothrix sp. PCC 7601]